MKYYILIIVVLLLTQLQAQHEEVDPCVFECEKKSEEGCGDGEACELSMMKVNQCTMTKCDTLIDNEEEIYQCQKDCISEFGHEAIKYYYTCIDKCIEGGEEDQDQNQKETEQKNEDL